MVVVVAVIELIVGTFVAVTGRGAINNQYITHNQSYQLVRLLAWYTHNSNTRHLQGVKFHGHLDTAIATYISTQIH